MTTSLVPLAARALYWPAPLAAIAVAAGLAPADERVALYICLSHHALGHAAAAGAAWQAQHDAARARALAALLPADQLAGLAARGVPAGEVAREFEVPIGDLCWRLDWITGAARAETETLIGQLAGMRASAGAALARAGG